MKYKCIRVYEGQEGILTLNKMYYGDVAIRPYEFSGGRFVEINGDDGHVAYIRTEQMEKVLPTKSDTLNLGAL